MSCKLGDKCDNVFACNILRPNVELLGCSFYKPKEPMTNEEYLKSCNTEHLAEWLADNSRFIYECGEKQVAPKTMHEEDWEWWLKQPHTIKE